MEEFLLYENIRKSYTLISQNVAFNMRLRDEIDACSPPWPVGRGPHESLHSKVLWGKGGMTERYEKSPAEWLGFLNGA